MNRLAVIGLFAVVVLAGCVNPYATYYRAIAAGAASQSDMRVASPDGNPKLVDGSNPIEDEKNLMREGYIPIGLSSFNAAEVNDNLALAQAKRVHAEVVLLCKQYTETYSGSTPVTTPATSSSVAAVSAGGASASSTVTGSSTVYVPYHIRRYDYTAIYFVRRTAYGLGVGVRDLTPEEQAANGSNKGVVVSIVVRGSPAFCNDILEGDVINEINGHEVLDKQQGIELVKASAGGELTISLRRKGAVIVKHVQLGEAATLQGP